MTAVPAEQGIAFRPMVREDVPAALSLYIQYYSQREGGCWTRQTASLRNHEISGLRAV